MNFYFAGRDPNPELQTGAQEVVNQVKLVVLLLILTKANLSKLVSSA